MTCHNCGAEVGIVTGDHRYAAGDGLYVLLKGVQKTKCDGCGEEGVVIPKVSQLNEALVKAIAKRPERLEPGEIRFLRKYLGWSGKDFARRMEVTPETVSRWETGTRRMGATAEKLLRFSAIELDPVEEYPVPELNDGKKSRSLELVLDKEWRVVA